MADMKQPLIVIGRQQAVGILDHISHGASAEDIAQQLAALQPQASPIEQSPPGRQQRKHANIHRTMEKLKSSGASRKERRRIALNCNRRAA